MATITFIQPPESSFSIDFRQFVDKSEENQTVQNAVFKVLKLIPVIAASLAKASYLTLKQSGSSFKVVVLGFYGDWSNYRIPGDFYLVVFKVALWVLGLGWCTVTMTFRLTIEKLFPASSQFLKNYASEGIDVGHIKTNEIGIDVSEVDANVKVDDLTQIFKEINFTDPQRDGYMAPLSRQEESTTYNPADLSKALDTFIHHVKNRTPFLATPPAYDMPRLSAFYQQIENAVRYSIHKSNKDIADFKNVNGEGPYNLEKSKEYSNLLENRARIAIDLAIAGKHCGTRYMGEAMAVYGSFRGGAANDKGSLGDYIIELLAQKRAQIANKHIQCYLGNETHAYTKYMANLGKILALPSTEHIIEHLDRDFDTDKFLKYFFKEYTVDCILTTIQEEIKSNKSKVLREKIYEWIRDYPNDWKKTDYDAAVEPIAQEVLSQLNGDKVRPAMKNALQFEKLVNTIKQSKNLPVLEDTIDIFIENLFNMDEVKRFSGTEFETSPLLVREKKCSALKSECLLTNLAAIDYKNTNEALEALAKACMNRAKNDQLQQQLDNLQSLFTDLTHPKVVLPELKENWNEYIQDIFNLDTVKKWKDALFSNLDDLQKRAKLEQLKSSWLDLSPSKQELDSLKIQNNTKEPLTFLCERWSQQLIVKRVREVIMLEEDTVVRLIKNPAGVQQAVADKLEQERGTEFLGAFKLERINEGISAALMEWLTVSQKILLPQEVKS